MQRSEKENQGKIVAGYDFSCGTAKTLEGENGNKWETEGGSQLSHWAEQSGKMEDAKSFLVSTKSGDRP